MNRNKLLARVHVLLKKAGLTDQKATVVRDFSTGRTSSLRELSDADLLRLCQHLAPMAQAGNRNQLGPMRAKVVAILCTLGYVTPEGKPDYARINAWCTARTAAGCPLLEQDYEELIHTVNTAEQYKLNVQPR
jgi:hypothetical protein